MTFWRGSPVFTSDDSPGGLSRHFGSCWVLRQSFCSSPARSCGGTGYFVPRETRSRQAVLWGQRYSPPRRGGEYFSLPPLSLQNFLLPASLHQRALLFLFHPALVRGSRNAGFNPAATGDECLSDQF